jgi:hypothetical protein
MLQARHTLDSGPRSRKAKTQTACLKRGFQAIASGELTFAVELPGVVAFAYPQYTPPWQLTVLDSVTRQWYSAS